MQDSEPTWFVSIFWSKSMPVVILRKHSSKNEYLDHGIVFKRNETPSNLHLTTREFEYHKAAHFRDQ